MMLSRLLQKGGGLQKGEDELCQKQDVNKFLACLIQLDGRLENFSGRCRRHLLKIEMCTNVKLYLKCSCESKVWKIHNFSITHLREINFGDS